MACLSSAAASSRRRNYRDHWPFRNHQSDGTHFEEFSEEYERLVLGPLKEQRKAAKAWRSALRKSSEEHQLKLEHQRKQMAVEARSSKILAAKAMEDAAKRRQALKKERAVRDAEAAELLEQQQREHERKSALEKTRVYCASQERRAKRRAERRRVAILRAEDEARVLDVAIRRAEEDASNSAAPLPSPENGSPALAADRETGPLLFALRSHLAKLADVRRRANKRVYSPRAARRACGRGRQSSPSRSAPTSASRKSPPGIPQQPAPPPLLISAVHLAPADAPATSSAASGDGASNGTIFVRTLGGALVALGFAPQKPIEALKMEVGAKPGTSAPSEMRLSLGGIELKDGRTLRDYEVQPGSTLQELIPVRGGMMMQDGGWSSSDDDEETKKDGDRDHEHGQFGSRALVEARQGAPESLQWRAWGHAGATNGVPSRPTPGVAPAFRQS